MQKHLLAASLLVAPAVGCSASDSNRTFSTTGLPSAGGSSNAGGAAGMAQDRPGATAGMPAGTGGTSIITPTVGEQLDASGPQLMSDVNVIITADNAYGFGYGTATRLVNYFGGVENITSADIFDCPVGMGAEKYTVPAADANVGGFLYIIGYADKQTTQGVLAKFFRDGALPVFSGSGPWEACATGEDYDPGSGGPTIDRINQQIANCNAANGDLATTSAGWVTSQPSPRGSVAIGEDNSTTRVRPMPGNEFLIACGIDDGAHWMWYEWESNRTTDSPFMWPGGRANTTKDFVIFRLGAENVPTVVR
jgi:hypothetical protein